jgi:uncharacterized protein YuzE
VENSELEMIYRIATTICSETMKMTFDRKADAMYIYIRESKVFKSQDITDDTIIDYDKDGNVVGIEILSASKRIPIEELTSPEIKQLA